MTNKIWLGVYTHGKCVPLQGTGDILYWLIKTYEHYLWRHSKVNIQACGYSSTNMLNTFIFLHKGEKKHLWLQMYMMGTDLWCHVRVAFLFCVGNAGIIFGSRWWVCVIGSVVIRVWLSFLLNSQCADQAGPVLNDPNSLRAQAAGGGQRIHP